MAFPKGNTFKRVNLKNQRFGRLIVIKFSYIKYGHSYWLCQCDCGKKKIVNAGSLKNNLTKSCGCLRKETISKMAKLRVKRPEIMNDLTGLKFTRWQVLKLSYRKNGKIYWECLCDCGKKKSISSSCLTLNKSKSCGCLRKEVSILNGKKKTRHGLSNTKFYTVWHNIKARCYNPKDISFKNYGGRGIKVCNRWHKFDNFMVDMYKNYLIHLNQFGQRNTSIDRINNNGNYEPNNCRWATYKEQNINQR